ncbi:hypothetical protein R84981_002806 [Carnimonas sp. R-84981]|uniref:hypothetical protein n=1 Tax=Carnimonas bestiolae TaxID=3402172 RepID=UPI003EDC43D8
MEMGKGGMTPRATVLTNKIEELYREWADIEKEAKELRERTSELDRRGMEVQFEINKLLSNKIGCEDAIRLRIS